MTVEVFSNYSDRKFLVLNVPNSVTSRSYPLENFGLRGVLRSQKITSIIPNDHGL